MPIRKHRTLYFLVVLILGTGHTCFALDVRCTDGRIIKYDNIELIGYKIEVSSDSIIKSLKIYDVVPSSLPDDIRNVIAKRLFKRYKKANKLYAVKEYSRAARYYKLIIKYQGYLFKYQIKTMEADNIRQRAKGKFLYKKRWITEAEHKLITEKEEAERKLITEKEEAERKLIVQKKFEESQKAKGLVLYNGQWVSKAQAEANIAIKNAIVEARSSTASSKAVSLLITAMANHPQATNLKKARMLKEKLDKLIAKKKFEELQKAKGLVIYEGQWISKAQADANIAINTAITEARSSSDSSKGINLLITAMAKHPQATNLEKACMLKKRLERPPTRIGIGVNDRLKPFKKLAFGNPKAKNDELSSLAFSPDGKFLIGGGSLKGHGTLLIWDAKNGKFIRQIKTKNETVGKISFSADGILMAHNNGEKGQEIWIWDTSIWKRKKTIRCSGITMSIALSPDGKTIVTSTTGKNISIWDISTTRELHTKQVADIAVSLSYSPDGKYFASGTRGKILIWDVKAGSILRKLILPVKSALAADLAYSADGRLLAEAGADGNVRLWEISSGRIRNTFKYGREYMCFSVAISPDGGTLVSRTFLRPTGSDRTAAFLAIMGSGGAEIWDVKTGKKRAYATTGFYMPYKTCSLAFSPDGQTLAVATNSGIELYR